MTRARYDVKDVHDVLDKVVADNPERVDRRAGDGLPPRYVEDGQPNCLVAELLHRMGVSIGVLKQLDREAGRFGAGIMLKMSEHAIRRRFTPAAWELLYYLQRQNDGGASWGKAYEAAFGPLDQAGFFRPRPEWRDWMKELES